MKRVVKFWGSSNHLVHIDGDIEGCGEHSILPGLSAFRVSDFANDQRCRILVLYDNTWAFAVSQDEGKLLPLWDFRVHTSVLQANDYTTILSMVVPETAKIELVAAVKL